MDIFSKYSIAFKGLIAGSYHYEFQIDGELFRAFEGSPLKDGACRAEVVMRRAENMLTFGVNIGGSVTVECDRCLEDCSLPVEFGGELVVRISENPGEYDGEVMWLDPGESEICLAQYLYESIELSLPYRRVHPDGPDGRPGCDPDMLKRFSIVSEEEFDRIESEIENGEAETIEQKLAEEGGLEQLAALKRRLEESGS